jgi:phage shock protein A
MRKQHHKKRVNYDQRLRQLEDEVRKLREANGELTSKNQELSATLEQYASAAASRKPTFSINYSSERNNLDSLSSVQSRRCPKRS